VRAYDVATSAPPLWLRLRILLQFVIAPRRTIVPIFIDRGAPINQIPKPGLNETEKERETLKKSHVRHGETWCSRELERATKSNTYVEHSRVGFEPSCQSAPTECNEGDLTLNLNTLQYDGPLDRSREGRVAAKLRRPGEAEAIAKRAEAFRRPKERLMTVRRA
jgi:hypothetical protein